MFPGVCSSINIYMNPDNATNGYSIIIKPLGSNMATITRLKYTSNFRRKPWVKAEIYIVGIYIMRNRIYSLWRNFFCKA